MNKKVKYTILISIIFITIIIIIIYYPYTECLSATDIQKITLNSTALALLVLLGIYCLKTVIMVIPHVVLYISAGLMFPTLWAIVVTYLCLAVEMTICFFMGRRLGRKSVISLIEKNERARRILEYFNENSVMSCFLIRFIPGPPADLTSMFIGATDVQYPYFILSTLLGLTPGMIPFVLAGKTAATPLASEFLIPFSISIALTFFLAAGYHLWLKNLKLRTNKY